MDVYLSAESDRSYTPHSNNLSKQEAVEHKPIYSIISAIKTAQNNVCRLAIGVKLT